MGGDLKEKELGEAKFWWGLLQGQRSRGRTESGKLKDPKLAQRGCREMSSGQKGHIKGPFASHRKVLGFYFIGESLAGSRMF